MNPNTTSVFNSIGSTQLPKNVFDLTHDVKLSTRMGELTPILCVETIPGDSFEIGADMLIRFAPLIAPVMHRFNATVHYWFVPNRLVWDNWEDFITGKTTGGIPTITVDEALTPEQIRFLDYFGIPRFDESWSGAMSQDINALPLAAYQKIYNDWYRDQNLITEVNCDLVDGNQVPGELATMRRRAWQHDYFTSCLPTPQKGAAVNLPYGDVTLKTGSQASKDPMFVETGTGLPAAGALAQNGINDITVGGLGEYMYDPDETLTTQPQTIAEFRFALKLQEFLEKLMRGGQRYYEVIQNFFGVTPSDARLQRPEYVGGIKQPVTISEVLNTSGAFDPADPSVAGSPAQGSMAGHGVSVGLGENSTFYTEEHGFIIGILNIQPVTAYQQGIPKTFLRNDPYDYYWEQFAHVGEQAVTQNEIFAYTNTPDATFGYQSRYAEYKSMPSRVAGDFRTSLNYWHAGRIFATAPALNQEFIEMDHEEAERIFAVNEDTDNLWVQLVNKVTARRPMSIYGTPNL